MLAGLLSAPACNTSKSAQGGAAGAATGAVLGGLIGNQSDNTAVGAIIGATVGGASGALIGRYMDKQAEKIDKKVEGAEVARVGEGILVTFDSGLLFDFDSYKLKPATQKNLRELATTLKEYDETRVLIEGHTDSKGSDEYNYELSHQRAEAVASYLRGQGLANQRLVIKGYGEAQPIRPNTTGQGREQNRRVEIAIYADEALIEEAKAGQL